MKNLSDFQKLLILQISTDIRAKRLDSLRRCGGIPPLDGSVLYDPGKWIDCQPTSAEVKRISRCCTEFERRGWLVRIVRGSGNRTIRVELTEAGHLAAEQIAAEGRVDA